MKVQMIPLRESQDAVRIAAIVFTVLGFIVGAVSAVALLP